MPKITPTKPKAAQIPAQCDTGEAVPVSPKSPIRTADDYIAASKASSTRREYAKDVKYFLESGGTIPATVAQVSEYLAGAAATLSPATLARRLVALHRHHIDHGFPSPVLTGSGSEGWWLEPPLSASTRTPSGGPCIRNRSWVKYTGVL